MTSAEVPTPAHPVTARPAAPDRLDLAGGWASTVCALHCALLPILLATLPGIGLELLDNSAFDRTFALTVSAFGGAVFATNLSAARRATVLACYAIAVLVLVSGAFGPVHGLVRGLVLAAGGATMALAHFINRAGLLGSGARVNLLRQVLRSR